MNHLPLRKQKLSPEEHSHTQTSAASKTDKTKLTTSDWCSGHTATWVHSLKSSLPVSEHLDVTTACRFPGDPRLPHGFHRPQSSTRASCAVRSIDDCSGLFLHVRLGEASKGSGVGPPLGSSRACLTAFVAFSVPHVSASPVHCSFRLISSPALPPCWGKRQVLLALGFSAGSHRCWPVRLVVAFVPCSILGLT